MVGGNGRHVSRFRFLSGQRGCTGFRGQALASKMRGVCGCFLRARYWSDPREV
jgi:hypothetical protein